MPQREENNDSSGNKTQQHRDERYWKAARIAALVAIIEAVSLVVWIKSEDFSPEAGKGLRWVSSCGFLAGAAYLAHKLVGKKRKTLSIAIIWSSWAIACLTFLIFPLNQATPNPGPHPPQVWQPPELPNGCTNVIASFGGEDLSIPIDIARISPEPGGSKFPLINLPSMLASNINSMPGFSPRQRNIWYRAGGATITIGDKAIPLPFWPYVLSNRFYVYVELPYGNRRELVAMSDDFASSLSSLPKPWDFNFSANSNICEIVNERTNPVLQVTYKKPNHIQVNGIFIVGAGNVCVTFGEFPPVLFSLSLWFTNKETREVTHVPLEDFQKWA